MGTTALCKIVTDAELEMIFQTIPLILSYKTRQYEYYIKLIFMVGAYMGLRASEVLNIKLEDIDWLNSTLTLRHQKNGNDWEKVVIPPFILQKFREHEQRYKLKIAESGGWIFFSTIRRFRLLGQHMPDGNLRNYVCKIRKVGEIGQIYKIANDKDNPVYNKTHCRRQLHTFSFHSLRHYYLTRVEDKMENIHYTAIAGRHKNIKSALRYQYTSMSRKKKIVERIFSDNEDKKEIQEIKMQLNAIIDILKDKEKIYK